MKTIEEKAKAYDEALERAKDVKNGPSPHDSSIATVEYIFPELAESEDERIIEEIKFAIMQMPSEREDTKQRCLAYLERQKKHKPTSFNEPYNPDGYDVVVEGNATSLKRKEQKPVKKQDYSGLNDLERAIHRGFLCAGVENVPVTIIKETAQDCLAQQKPAWSEEDEDAVRHICRYLGYHCNEATARGCTEWLNVRLKSLRPIKQDWSEEDEKLLDFWLDVIDRNDWRMDENFCKASREFINRLKSLRPQSKQEWSEEDEKIMQTMIKEGDLKSSDSAWATLCELERFLDTLKEQPFLSDLEKEEKPSEGLKKKNIFANKDLNKEWKKFSEQENIESL